jgi:putative ABC transport system permease protein
MDMVLQDNVELGMTLSGISKAERRQKAEDALIRVGLKDHIHKKPYNLQAGF